MEKVDILLCAPVAFLIFLVVFGIFSILAKRFSPKPAMSKGKVSTYACGEEMPGFKFQFGYSLFFVFALFFTVMHVAALVIATLPAKAPELYCGFFYLAAIFLCVSGLVMYRDEGSESQKRIKEDECD